MKIEKPFLRQYDDNEWEFVYPSSIDNENVFDLFYEGVEFLDYNDKEAERIFKSLIKNHPYHIDAYNHLSIAFRNQNKTFESLLTAEKAYTLGKECFPKDFDYRIGKISWGWLENRPFLRACQIYGLECQYAKNYNSALKLYQENLSFNENDNQGIRYLLLETLLVLKEYNQAEKLIEKYEDDFSIEFKYGLVSLYVLKGDYNSADNHLIEAVQTNQHFIKEVSKQKHIKPEPFRISNEPYFDTGIQIGSIQQAFDYWERNKSFYKTKKLIEYYKSKL
ncbi:MAG: hypothetical protein WCR58_03000 [Bacteroidales bacterium]|jgi:hypothetical protein|nr:hypothetical protein [Bacteroidales bacterium]MDD3700584.1 hypothetical protein [Bacteroidales bacterium]MDY0368292.1 hypothetical protein [Bacteroidales bacterium]